MGTYWALLWTSRNLLDGVSSHLIHEDLRPALFTTRASARAYAEEKYGYIRERPDLQAEPHGWSVPQAILVMVMPASLDRR